MAYATAKDGILWKTSAKTVYYLIVRLRRVFFPTARGAARCPDYGAIYTPRTLADFAQFDARRA